jgi:Tol biopolymer transport system component
MGVVLGTAAYMSPEQAKGKPTDRTTDMWAYGCVVFEMITGHAAFEGDSVGEILGSIFKAEPDWTLLPPDTPASIRRLLRRCLQKDRTLRLRDAGDARLEIAEAPEDVAPTVATSPATRRRQLAWAGTLTGLGLIVGALGALQLPRAPLASELWFDIAMPASPPGSRFAVSPDGKRVVFRGERQQLWIRSFESATVTPVAGTSNGTFPFWSADSQSIGFFAEGKLRRIAAEGGQARDLAGASLPRGGTWNRENVILFAPTLGSPIMRMSASGGEATPVTTMRPDDSAHLAPQFLPDGRHFLYYVISRADASGVYISDLTSAETRQVLKTESAAVYGSSALFYARQSELVAQSFDADRLATAGAPQVLGPVVMGPSDIPSVSVADGGPIVFRAPSDGSQGDSGASAQFVWLDRSGKEVARVADAPPGFGRSAVLSPDDNHVAYTRVVTAGEADIWLLEISRGVFSRFTLEKGDDVTPVWSPDGGRIVFGRREKGVINLYEKPLAGAAGSERLLLSSDQDKSATDWSRDGKYLLYSSIDPKTNSDIWAMRMDGDRPAAGSPRPVLQTAFQEGGARMSPDGQWMAYQSNKSGRPEIYVQPFPGPGADVPVSTSGGTSPRWRRDGKEIYYLAPDNRLMAVSIRPTPAGSPLQLETPVPLFQSTNDEYMVSPDGQRFLKYSATAASSTSPLSVIVNWRPRKE